MLLVRSVLRTGLSGWRQRESVIGLRQVLRPRPPRVSTWTAGGVREKKPGKVVEGTPWAPQDKIGWSQPVSSPKH